MSASFKIELNNATQTVNFITGQTLNCRLYKGVYNYMGKYHNFLLYIEGQ